MDSSLYNKKIVCPVCMKEFEMTKVKSKACRVQSRDTDFCVYYEGINPIFYDPIVCENCGYAALSDKFEEIAVKDAKIIKETISPRWVKRSFAGERSIDIALETFKLALYNLQVRKGKASEIAKVCLRIAWLYRIKKDEKENDFLKFALNYYNEMYMKERLPVDKLDEFTVMYMIAELSRRTGNISEAVQWFSKVVSSPEARKNTQLIEMAREQFQLAKQQE
ncbi:MAG TPA: DUF2225 domain-containing protein [Clostridia bacterium]|nr:DUF2225 domain-containing protein [Clostridia bacterium]